MWRTLAVTAKLKNLPGISRTARSALGSKKKGSYNLTFNSVKSNEKMQKSIL